MNFAKLFTVYLTTIRFLHDIERINLKKIIGNLKLILNIIL